MKPLFIAKWVIALQHFPERRFVAVAVLGLVWVDLPFPDGIFFFDCVADHLVDGRHVFGLILLCFFQQLLLEFILLFA